MTLAQAMDPVSVSGIGDFAGKFGFPALLVLVLIYGIWKMQERVDKARDEREKALNEERAKREERDERREAERRTEREADRSAHVTALAQHTASLNNLGLVITESSRKLDTLIDATRDNTLRSVKGG